MTGNDAAIYMEKAINTAEGRGFISSINRHILGDREKIEEYVAKYGNRNQEIKVAPLYIWSISRLYSLVGLQSFMLSINLFNLLLFIVCLLLVYYQFNKEYPERKLIPLLTTVMLGFNFTMYRVSFGAYMEYMSLLIFIVCYITQCKVIEAEDRNRISIFFYGILLSLLFLSKYSTAPFVAAFVLQFMLKKRYLSFVVLSITVIILAGSWFVLRDLLANDRIITYFGRGFPFENGDVYSPITSFIISIQRLVRTMTRFFRIFNKFDGLSFLFPFAVIFLFTKPYNYKKQLLLLMITCTIPFFLYYGHVEPRYIYPVLLLLIPVGINEIIDYVRCKKIKHIYLFMSLLMLIYLLSQSFVLVNFFWDTRKKAIDRESLFKGANELIEANEITSEKVILHNIIGFCVYSAHGLVRAPTGMTFTNKYEVLGVYRIDYVLFAANQLHHLAMWEQNLVPRDIFTDLELFGVSEIDDRVRLYRVPDNKDIAEPQISTNKRPLMYTNEHE